MDSRKRKEDVVQDSNKRVHVQLNDPLPAEISEGAYYDPLPPEVWSMVTMRVDSTRDLLALRATCRTVDAEVMRDDVWNRFVPQIFTRGSAILRASRFYLEHSSHHPCERFVAAIVAKQSCFGCSVPLCHLDGNHVSSLTFRASNPVQCIRICAACIKKDKRPANGTATLFEYGSCQTWSKSMALREFALASQDLDPLPFNVAPNPFWHGMQMRLYIHAHLLDVALKKHGSIDAIVRAKLERFENMRMGGVAPMGIGRIIDVRFWTDHVNVIMEGEYGQREVVTFTRNGAFA